MVESNIKGNCCIQYREKSMLAKSETTLMFILSEKINLGSYANGSEITSNGKSRYKSAKETSPS